MTRSLRVFVRHTKQSLESLVDRKISQQGIKKLSIIFFIFLKIIKLIFVTCKEILPLLKLFYSYTTILKK